MKNDGLQITVAIIIGLMLFLDKTPVFAAGSPNLQAKPSTEDYEYNATGKPDPFIPLIKGPKRIPEDDTGVETPLAPLQRYELEELMLVALVSANEEALAVIETPDGFGHIVKAGSLIGPNEGVIKKIMLEGVVVDENVIGTDGNFNVQTRILKIIK